MDEGSSVGWNNGMVPPRDVTPYILTHSPSSRPASTPSSPNTPLPIHPQQHKQSYLLPELPPDTTYGFLDFTDLRLIVDPLAFAGSGPDRYRKEGEQRASKGHLPSYNPTLPHLPYPYPILPYPILPHLYTSKTCATVNYI